MKTAAFIALTCTLLAHAVVADYYPASSLIATTVWDGHGVLPTGAWIDLNGDGLIDFIEAAQNNFAGGVIYRNVQINTGCGFATNPTAPVTYCRSDQFVHVRRHGAAAGVFIPLPGSLDELRSAVASKFGLSGSLFLRHHPSQALIEHAAVLQAFHKSSAAAAATPADTAATVVVLTEEEERAFCAANGIVFAATVSDTSAMKKDVQQLLQGATAVAGGVLDTNNKQ